MKFVTQAAIQTVCVCVCVCVCHSYRNLVNEHETLMQKYLHLLQIVETEKTVAKQLRQQIEDGEIEIERLKSEVIFTVIPFTLNMICLGCLLGLLLYWGPQHCFVLSD